MDSHPGHHLAVGAQSGDAQHLRGAMQGVLQIGAGELFERGEGNSPLVEGGQAVANGAAAGDLAGDVADAAHVFADGHGADPGGGEQAVLLGGLELLEEGIDTDEGDQQQGCQGIDQGVGDDLLPQEIGDVPIGTVRLIPCHKLLPWVVDVGDIR